MKLFGIQRRQERHETIMTCFLEILGKDAGPWMTLHSPTQVAGPSAWLIQNTVASVRRIVSCAATSEEADYFHQSFTYAPARVLAEIFRDMPARRVRKLLNNAIYDAMALKKLRFEPQDHDPTGTYCIVRV